MSGLWLVEVGLSLALRALSGKPRPMVRDVVFSPEVQEVPVGVTLRATSTPTPKRPTEGSMPHPDGSACMHNGGTLVTIVGGAPCPGDEADGLGKCYSHLDILVSATSCSFLSGPSLCAGPSLSDSLL
ncbi:hypothetical protein BHE74_00045162 [Ensete ventricosum]|nr:hypothetical protein BHE74_00045162 [Ensete ventricosum]